MENDKEKARTLNKIKTRLKLLWRFLTYDIWRITDQEITGIKHTLVNIIKTLILSVRFFLRDRLSEKASALTYNTMLAIVPLATMLLAISRGFGFQDIIENQMHVYFPGQEQVVTMVFEFVTNYLNQAKNGIFVGIGLIFLLWTVVSLIRNIESVFNHIWQIPRSRSIFRQFSDYLSMVLLMPIFMIASSGLSIFISTGFKLPYFQFLLNPLIVILVKVAPFFITCMLFTIIYVIIPNTRVKFMSAFWAGLVAGVAFQIFQFFYINGQIWVAKYNAIYGSFAALPLLLLWVQLSWLICLYGAELAYAADNVNDFNFEQDSNNISRRYHDYICLLIASIIIRRFDKQQMPISTGEIATTYKIPSKLTSQILHKLNCIGIINEVISKDEKDHRWQPAVDINIITIGLIMDRIDRFGSENLRVDKDYMFNNEWLALLNCKNKRLDSCRDILLKDFLSEESTEQIQECDDCPDTPDTTKKISENIEQC